MQAQTENLDPDEAFAALMARVVEVAPRSFYGLIHGHALKKIADEAEALCRRPRNRHSYDMMKPDISPKKRAPRMVKVTLSLLHAENQETAA